ncbi:CYTH domain-containing protein [Alkalicoccus urumqiensis]|uniref:CYTH domain-containing protein n=1 Tax=Alkalicoccus urumqiensis TaxID=1548213 RepID=A0A2P6MEZ8_ALKUR|nr:CYTH domain-containing protein [Alkalicoccus urumqiensis]PRO64844.1 CYTH domain-containing protein [Alkalicoccus urumqiensis]
MPQEIEIEFKQLLTRAAYDRLLEQFTGVQPFHQVNHYFETDDMALRRKHAALRIREKGSTWELTLKQPHEEGLLETNQPIGENSFEAAKIKGILPEGETTAQLRHFLGGMPALVYLGSLETTRREMEISEGMLVLDHSFYAGTEDYELEFECRSAEKGKAYFQSLLADLELEWNEPPNKIQRFYQAVYENKENN